MWIADRLRIGVAVAALQSMQSTAIAAWIMQQPGAAKLVQRFAYLSDEELWRMFLGAEQAMPSVDWRPVFCWIHDHPQMAVAIVAELRRLARATTDHQGAAYDGVSDSDVL